MPRGDGYRVEHLRRRSSPHVCQDADARPLLVVSTIKTRTLVGKRRIPYATTGLVGYDGPSLQFLIAVLLFHETFDPQRAGFGCIWLALGIYSADVLLSRA